MNLEAFRSPGRKGGKFVDMSHFIKSKNSDQCRSHHQKMIKHTDVEIDLRSFLKEEYEERLLDAEQIVREMTHFLTKSNRKYMKEEMIASSMDIIRENWKKVMKEAPEEEGDENGVIEDLDSPTKHSSTAQAINNLDKIREWQGIDFFVYEENSNCVSQ